MIEERHPTDSEKKKKNFDSAWGLFGTAIKKKKGNICSLDDFAR